ncbi:hypothetical protein LEP1GSC048_1414 [Leptospira santarosai serovar Shermani str. 1342KT]|nr:hypothetical protein LEP1GSC048_1414 [Leptospira santarosai serovar Shermani str. 1342KT]
MIAHLKVASRTEESYSFLNPDLRVQNRSFFRCIYNSVRFTKKDLRYESLR